MNVEEVGWGSVVDLRPALAESGSVFTDNAVDAGHARNRMTRKITTACRSPH